MDIEDWMLVDGYGWDYWVSSHGRVMSFKGRYPIVLAQTLRTGYPSVGLLLNGRQKFIRVHKLVAEAFLKNPADLKTVNHKDGNKTNNRVENLEWSSYSDNNSHALYSGLKNQIRPVVAIPMFEPVGFFFPSMSYAKKDGFHQGHISAVCLGKLPYHRGFKWEKVDTDMALSEGRNQ